MVAMKRVLLLATLLAAHVANAQPGQLDDRASYEAGYQAMLRGDYIAARAAFATAASTTTDPMLQRTASEMARLAADMAARANTIASMPAPGQPVHVFNEDEERSG